MNLAVHQFAALVAKDLRIEARSRQTIGLITVLGILILVVLGLGLRPSNVKGGASATSILWVAYLFGGVLCFEKTMAVERQDGALAGLLLAPVDRGVLFASKLFSNLVLMLSLVLVITMVGIVMFRFDLGPAPGWFALITALSMLGFAAVGTLFAAAVSSSRLQGGLLALVVFPVCLPLVIVSTQMTEQLALKVAASAPPSTGLTVLGAFDVIYLTVSWLVFELLLEP